jgi:TolB-like protein/Flp pilus assembly protein TadD
MERRLAAIMAADVVGYSRLIRVDEEGTLAALKALRVDLIDPKIAEHHGRIVKLMGDGMLTEFASVVDAVRAAVEMQQAVADRNADLPKGQRIEFRVGVNLGDVVIDDDDIHGDGVNVAARLEGIAEAGGICVSGSVYDQVRDRIDFPFEDLGEQEVKNIDRPVRVWRWAFRDSIRPPEDKRETDPSPPHDKPSIAVLPFDNLSGDPEQEYFADGIAEDIISALSRFTWFFVIARNSSFAFKGQAIDVKQLAHELRVQYVLEGSVRKVGKRVRIAVQLIDARVDHHVWAERYDRDLEDIFAVQDEITERVITSVAPGIVSAEMQRAHRKDIASLDAWDRVMRAHWHLARFTMEDHAEARRLLSEAVQIEPNSAHALGDLAMIHVLDGQWGWGISRDQSLAAAAEAARHAVTIDEGNTWAQIALGFVELFARRHDESVRRLKRAIEISPNDPHAHAHLGFALSFAGESEAAIAQVEEAMRLSPRDPFLAFWYTAQALAAFSAGRYKEAVDCAKKTIEENPRHPGAYRLLAASHAQLGHIEDAKVALKEMLHQMPGMTVTATRQQVPWKKSDDAARYLEGLRKAGLPE